MVINASDRIGLQFQFTQLETVKGILMYNGDSITGEDEFVEDNIAWQTDERQ